MGAGASVEDQEREGVKPIEEGQTAKVRSRARQSIALGSSGLGIVPTQVKKLEGNVFQIRVPAGARPLGTFPAVCGDQYVQVMVPEDASTGDLIEIDLGDVVTGQSGTGAQAPDGSTATPVQIPEHHESDLMNEEKMLRRAVELFKRYSDAGKFSLTMAQLETMLEEEFHFPHGSEEIRAEMIIADVDRSMEISFDEFRHWLAHLQMRIEVHRLHEERKALVGVLEAQTSQVKLGVTPPPGAFADNAPAPAPTAKEAEPRDSATSDASAHDDEEEEDEDAKRIKSLMEEQAAVREQVEKQRQEFQAEIESLRKEKQRLESQLPNLVAESEEYEQLKTSEKKNEQRIKIMEEHHQRNEIMIQKIIQDSIALDKKREDQKKARREAQRRRIAERKKMLTASRLCEHCNGAGCEHCGNKPSSCHGCGGARRACGCPRRVLHCAHCADSEKCEECHKTSGAGSS